MEIALASFRNSFFASSHTGDGKAKLASARAGNVVGGGDWAANRIVPDAVRALHLKKALILRHPDAVRPWQHVLEPLSGYLALGAALSGHRGEEFATSWNFGPDTSQMFRVADLVDTLISEWGSGSWITNSSPNGHHEAMMLRLSIDKASLELGWRPVWSFEETVKRTVNWYSSFLAAPENQTATYERCMADILAYESEACKKGVAWARQAIGTAVEY
jgi:CDP-glucose 4,6-dehydratase